MFQRLQRAKDIFKYVIDATILGPGNMRINGDEKARVYRRDLIEFGRDLTEEVLKSKELAPMIATNFDLQKFDAVISSVFTTLFKCGSCGERSKLAVIKFLKRGFGKSVEIIHIEDRIRRTDHSFVVLDKIAKSDPKDPTKYGDCIRFDAWDGVNLLTEHSSKNPLTLKDLQNSLIHHFSEITSLVRFDTNFSQKDWLEFCKVLKIAKTVLTRDVVAKLMAKNNILHTTVDNMFNSIQEKLGEEINFYFALAHPKLAGPGRMTMARLFSNPDFDSGDKINKEMLLQITQTAPGLAISSDPEPGYKQLGFDKP